MSTKTAVELDRPRGRVWDLGKEPPRVTMSTNGEPRTDHNLRLRWLDQIPLRLRQRLLWERSTTVNIPEEAIILLYTGPDDGGALDDWIKHDEPESNTRIRAYDISSDIRQQDLLSDEPWSSLRTATAAAKLSFIWGGPMCRTWSVLRLVAKLFGGLPCRGRPAPWCWGLQTVRRGDRRSDKIKTDGDSVLLLLRTNDAAGTPTGNFVTDQIGKSAFRAYPDTRQPSWRS